jgi:hypothetical protein
MNLRIQKAQIMEYHKKKNEEDKIIKKILKFLDDDKDITREEILFRKKVLKLKFYYHFHFFKGKGFQQDKKFGKPNGNFRF